MEDQEKLLRNITGGIWKTESVEDQPELTLRDWRIVEVLKEPKTMHFVGYAVENFEGRVSSGIVKLDPLAEGGTVGVTASGRVYKLIGNPGLNDDAVYVWNAWKRINNVSDGEFKVIIGPEF